MSIMYTSYSNPKIQSHSPLSTFIVVSAPSRVVDPLCLSCFQFLEGSDFLNKLNEGGDTVPGVQYKFIVSKFDQVVTPYTNGKLRDNNPLVQNVVLQDLCVVDLR